MYKVICGLNGAYPAPETIVWPVCQPTHCTDAIPSISGFKTGNWPSVIKVEIFLEQREVAFLSPSKICENLNY